MVTAIESASGANGGLPRTGPRAAAARMPEEARPGPAKTGPAKTGASQTGASQTRIDREIGSVLRRVRLGAGLSQQAVARLVGTSFQQVQKYERGVNRVPLSRLIRFCEALDVTVLDVVAEVVEIAGGAERQDARAADAAAATRLGARAMAAVARVEDPQVLEAVIRLLDSVNGNAPRAQGAGTASGGASETPSEGRREAGPAPAARVVGRNA